MRYVMFSDGSGPARPGVISGDTIRPFGAGIASQVGMVGPVSTIVLADLFLDEKMGPVQIVGTALVLIGVFIVSQAGAGRSVPAISNR